jgi:UDP-N-acetylmuramoyl-L-alanyl-D-glutamate--2,6-diaminopimelate ligase
MQRIVQPDAPLAVVDYAHTPDALTQALQALRPLADARHGRLWVVFGAGGDRDQGKRAPMGAAAAGGADVVVVTSDNPRTEDPSAIVAQIALGARGAGELVCVLDRSEAIAHAVGKAAAEDVVLVAGKGHEDYQIVGTRKQPYSDLAQVRAALSERGRR